MMITRLGFLIWLILVVVMASGGWGRVGVPIAEPVPADRPAEVIRRPATFTESFRWIDGLSVEVVEIEHTRLLASTTVDAPNARVGDPCSELTIVVRNGSDHHVRVALTARLRYGPDVSSAGVYVPMAGHADHATVQYIAPGEVSYPYTLGFLLPADARDDVLLEIGIDNWKHDPAVFAGTIATR
jgi:hypothetical protein